MRRARVKYDPKVIVRRFKILLPLMVNNWRYWMMNLDALEIRVFMVLEFYNVASDLWPYYVNFAKRLENRVWHFTGQTYEDERTSLITEFILRRLDETVLESIVLEAEELAYIKLEVERSVLIGGCSNGNLTTNGFYCPQGISPGVGVEAHVGIIIAVATNWKNFRVQLEDPPGVGTSWTLTVRLERDSVTNNTLLSVTISDLETTGEDEANLLALEPGDKMTIQATRVGVPVFGRVQWGIQESIV